MEAWPRHRKYTAMARDDKYFQFPIKVLRDTWEDSATLGHTIVNVALQKKADEISKLLTDDSDYYVIAERYADRYDIEYCGDDDEVALLAASDFLNVRLNNDSAYAAIERIRRAASRYQPSTGTQCRLRTGIVWSMIEDAWPVNKTRTLVAVYAGIGQNKSQWLAYSRIRALSGGYSGITDVKQKLVTKTIIDQELPSLKTVRYWVDRLWQRSLFQLIVVQNNRRIYSNKHKDDQALRDYFLSQKKHRKRLEKL